MLINSIILELQKFNSASFFCFAFLSYMFFNREFNHVNIDKNFINQINKSEDNIMNKLDLEYRNSSIVITRQETKKQFIIKANHVKELAKLIKSNNKQAYFDYILKNVNYLRSLELDAQAKKTSKCINTAYDSRYTLARFINADVNLQQYNSKKASAQKISKAIKKIKTVKKVKKAKTIKK